MEKSKDAHVLLMATIARAKLLYGDLEGTRADMEKAWSVLDTLDDVEPGVNAAYYGLAADFYKVKPIDFLFCQAFIECNRCRLRQNIPLTIKTPCCTLHA